MVPYAIAEADRLYGKHVYISVANLQTLAVRDESMREESGLDRPTEKQDSFTEASVLDVKISECGKVLNDQYSSEKRPQYLRLNQKLEDLRRLKRVDILYVSD